MQGGQDWTTNQDKASNCLESKVDTKLRVLSEQTAQSVSQEIISIVLTVLLLL